jgi:1,4-alpha-glucan branching enzyme
LNGNPSDVFIHDDDHVIGYVRDGLVLAYNFHPTKSYEDYGFSVPYGNYRIVLSTDAPEFGGSNRIDTTLDYPSNGLIRLYLPARTAVVLGRV